MNLSQWTKFAETNNIAAIFVSWFVVVVLLLVFTLSYMTEINRNSIQNCLEEFCDK